MAKVKSIIDADQIRLYGTLDSNLNGVYFNNTASQTIFSFGSFVVTSNFEGRIPIDYSNILSSFVRPVTLETMGLTDIQSEIILKTTTEAVLNLDKSDFNTFVRFGSAYEFLRISIEDIILNYPASIFASSNVNVGGNLTFGNFNYDLITNTSYFIVPTASTVNTFGIIFNAGNNTIPNDDELRNLNLSYDKYIIWSSQNPTGNSFTIIGFTGCTSGHPYLRFKVSGNPFPNFIGTSGNIDFHIKPNNKVFEEFRARLNDYEKYMLSARDGVKGFKFKIKDPVLLEDGNVSYSDAFMIWTTTDEYNIDISGSKYRTFLETILNVGAKYDSIKTDLIARFLTPASIKTYDLTEEGKMTKLLRLYGREFDELRQFIDSLVYINRVTYDKVNNVPDQLIKNLSRTFGWDYFSLVNENELVESFLTISDEERNLNTDLMPAEIDIELWRRILINTSYFWKSKGTREAIKSMFLLIGIPEPFINITEYVYTVDGKINPNDVALNSITFPSLSLPYDNSGYPVAPIESNTFYFQMSGDTDSGQAYMDVFRMAGFNLTPVVDNKKSWIQTSATTRVDDTTPQYFQEDSRLVLNTKEVDVALDTARGIEYDVFDYIKNTDFPANSSGYTLPFSFVNISLDYTGTQTSFQLPFEYDPANIQGKLEVRYNGILLTTRDVYDGSNIVINPNTNEIDYYIVGNTIYLNNSNYAVNSGNRRDVIQATFIYSGTTNPMSGITVEYIVARISPTILGAAIPLPSYPRGDVQVTVNGIAMTKGTSQFSADYILDPANSTGGSNNIIIQNPEIISYLALHPNVTVAYVQVQGTNEINARSEVVRVDSFNTGKIYFNLSANKYVYKMNYKANGAKDIKVLVDGIALEPYKDYNINVMNPYEFFLPSGIRYGTVISVYYLVGGSTIFFPVVPNTFGVGDISQLSFLEFIELLQRRMINARNRKTITDFKGGWYPSLLNVYVEYLKRAGLDPENPLLSNGYTFNNLYSFLSKYNAFFQRFIDQLLSATIILKKSGLLIRNTIFTKQKFAYKRGVNLFSGDTVSSFDKRGMPMIPYYGDDGSTFLIPQDEPLPSATIPTVITSDVSSIAYNSANGGGNVTSDGGAAVLTRGVVWDTLPNPLVEFSPKTNNGFGIGVFTSNLTGLAPETTYYVRAYATNVVGTGYGDNIEFTTEAAPLDTPVIHTRTATDIQQTSFVTGGINIVRWADVEYYGMKYKVSGSTTWLYFPVAPASGPLAADFTPLITITGLVADTNYQYYAYMIVDGTEYTGETFVVKTSAIPLAVPIVTTGNAANVVLNGMDVNSNVVTGKGIPATIVEYGVLYVQSSYWGDPANFKWENSPATIGRVSNTGDVSVPHSYNMSITGLTPNFTTFYRAFARNGATESTVGYGEIKNVLLPSLPSVRFEGALSMGDQAVGYIQNHTAGLKYAITLTYDIDIYADTTGTMDEGSVSTTNAIWEISRNGGTTWVTGSELSVSAYGSVDNQSVSEVGEVVLSGTSGMTDFTQLRIRGYVYASVGWNMGGGGVIRVRILTVRVYDSADNFIGFAEVQCPNMYVAQNTFPSWYVDCL